jgi:hypothetical protein
MKIGTGFMAWEKDKNLQEGESKMVRTTPRVMMKPWPGHSIRLSPYHEQGLQAFLPVNGPRSTGTIGSRTLGLSDAQSFLLKYMIHPIYSPQFFNRN